MNKVQKELYKMQDKKYGAFQATLIPTVEKKRIIGVRTPALKNFAKKMIKENQIKEIEKFLKDLPHKYFDEMQLHAFLLNELKDYDKCINEIEKFLSYIDNWATCDQLSPKIFSKNKNDLLKRIKKWIKAKKAYTIRFGIGMLMQHFLDEDFDEKYLQMVANIKSAGYKDTDLYYIEMMRAWFFATALAKQYKATIPYIEKRKLDVWTHNKTIQKAVESYRITEKQKELLKKLKIK